MYAKFYADHIKKIGLPKQRLLWASTMPIYRNDGFPRGFRDWRTMHRLQVFNEVANRAFHEVSGQLVLKLSVVVC
jgi:hypothetical protein